MFLLICSHTMDDIPLALLPTLEAAIERGDEIFARTASEYAAGSVSEELMPAYWKTDASTPVCLDIVEFDSKGVPVKCSWREGLPTWCYDEISMPGLTQVDE